MSEPWNERVSDARPEPSIYTFVIFCEDNVSEPEYFESFGKNHLSVITERGYGDKKLNVNTAIQFCKDKGLLKWDEAENSYIPMFEEGFQVWCVFDRDKPRGNVEDKVGDTGFYTSVKSAKDHFINVAWSNDAFELWVLLHVQDVDPANPDYNHRDKYYEQLEKYMKSIPNPIPELEKRTTNATFNYDHLKTKRAFIPIVLPILKANVPVAIGRAKKLEEFHTNKPCHEQTPCTLVHHLVLELIEKGKNE